jgi:hypothetical protein
MSTEITPTSEDRTLTSKQRRMAVIGAGALVVILGGIGIGAASAGTNNAKKSNNTTAAAPGAIVCPSVKDKLPANIPASAQAEVDRNLALLDTQIAEANKRLQETVGQGGPAFVQNAILGPLKSKRAATLDRIAISIGRQGTRPQGLEAFAECSLNAGGAAPQAPATTAPANNPPANGGGQAAPPAAGNGQRIVCPSVKDKLPANIPASAQAEVDRNLALLDTQIAEANTRLANSVGQGGPAFVQNAILGPLADKRAATLDRIAISIGRQGTRPQGLEVLATCSLG